MPELPHIYRQKKLTNISQRRYKRKYNPEYLEEKASHGASIKLGFGDFDGDGDLDGLYPKQRAGVAEKPGLHVDPPRGLLSMSRLGFAEPSFGPSLIQSVTVVPQAGPASLDTSTAIPAAGPTDLGSVVGVPAEGPGSLASSVIVPQAGPSALETSEVVPQSGPSSITSSVTAPQSGPSSITSSVTAPQAGPSSLDYVNLSPDVGPVNLSSTVVVPASGPLQVSAITNPLAGVLNLNASIAAPFTGPSSVVSVTETPAAGVSNLQTEVILTLNPIYKLTGAQGAELTGYPSNFFFNTYYSFDFSFDNSRYDAIDPKYHSIKPSIVGLDFFNIVESGLGYTEIDQLVTVIRSSGIPDANPLITQYSTLEAIEEALNLTEPDIVGYWNVDLPLRGRSIWNFTSEQINAFDWEVTKESVTVDAGTYAFYTHRESTGTYRNGEKYTRLLPCSQDGDGSWTSNWDSDNDQIMWDPFHEWEAILDKLAEQGLRQKDAVGYLFPNQYAGTAPELRL